MLASHSGQWVSSTFNEKSCLKQKKCKELRKKSKVNSRLTHTQRNPHTNIYILNHTPIRKKFSMQIKYGSLENFHLWLPESLAVSISYRKVNIGIPIPIARAPAQSCIWFGDLRSHRCSLEDVCTLDNLKTFYPNLEETKVASFSNSWMTNGILVSKSNGTACIREKVSLWAMSRPGWFFD